MTDRAPELAREVVEVMLDVLGDALVGAYLHGSSVLGGMRPTSDIDILAVIDRPTSIEERRAIVDRLLGISGRRAYRGPARPVELTIVVGSEVRPWRFPPCVEFQYGEWLRDEYEAGRTPEPVEMADLGPEIALALQGNRSLFGPPPAEVLDPMSPADLRRAIVHGVPSLVADLASDTRNVLLTLVRIWHTLETGAISSKDAAATWATPRVAAVHRPALERARRMYLDGIDDNGDTWSDMAEAVRGLAHELVAQIDEAQRR